MKGIRNGTIGSGGVAEVAREKSITKLVVAVSIGNALEWYDISSYGYFAIYVSKAFFPNSDPTISLLLTLAHSDWRTLFAPSAASCSAPMPTATAARLR